MNDETVKILLYIKGDMSVGIHPVETVLDTKMCVSDFDLDENKDLFDSMADNFGEMWGEKGYWELMGEDNEEIICCECKKVIIDDKQIVCDSCDEYVCDECSNDHYLKHIQHYAETGTL